MSWWSLKAFKTTHEALNEGKRGLKKAFKDHLTALLFGKSFTFEIVLKAVLMPLGSFGLSGTLNKMDHSTYIKSKPALKRQNKAVFNRSIVYYSKAS